VHRLLVLTCALLILSGCGKKVRVSAPIPPAAAASELEGIASYYGEPYHGRRTANGEVFDTYKGMTAAHRTLPFNTLVRVTNKANGKEVDVRINDRGPFIEGRVIDLSLLAARQIDLERAGITPVKLKVLKEGEADRRTSAPQTTYAVQVGAFENLNAAEDLRRRLESKYPGVSVQTASADTTIYRVRIGPEPDLLSAEKLAAQLREEAIDSFVVRLN
jgi:rare lipoprotein A